MTASASASAISSRRALPSPGAWPPQSRRHHARRRQELRHRGTPYQANRAVAVLSKMFSWSGRRGERNPCIGLERFQEHKRRRYLSHAELKRLGDALSEAESQGSLSPFALAAIRLLI